jgi:hypothetical protein
MQARQTNIGKPLRRGCYLAILSLGRPAASRLAQSSGAMVRARPLRAGDSMIWQARRECAVRWAEVARSPAGYCGDL